MARKKRAKKVIQLFTDKKGFLLLLLLATLIVIFFVLQGLWLWW